MTSRIPLARLGAILAVVASSLPALAQHGGPGGPPLGGPLFRILGAVGSTIAGVNQEAMHAYETLPRDGTCDDRRTRLLAMLPDALVLAKYAYDIYEKDHEGQMRSANETFRKLGEGHFAHYDPKGGRYAEVRLDPARQRATIVFRGTRLGVRSDLTTNVLNFIGIESGYYDWAASLVANVKREHPDLAIFTTGHSLGGGLALYSVLRNPGVKALVFNPSGLSENTWRTASYADRERTNASVIAVSLRNLFALEPVTALSFAGRSVLPGHIFVLRGAALRPAKLHTAGVILAALKKVSDERAAGSVCNGDVGVIVE